MFSATEASKIEGVGFRCINCGWRIRRLFMQYSPGNIRLMKCDNCKAVADPYIECEFMIIFIDLILHKTKAFRHLLYNMLNLEKINKDIVLKAGLMYFILDACRVSLSSKIKGNENTSRSSLVFTCAPLQVLLDVLLGNFMLASVLWIMIWIMLISNYHIPRYTQILLAILVTSYFKMFLLVMMVWDFPPAAIFIVDIFVLSSNIVALRVLTQLRTSTCIALLLSSHGAKFLVFHRLLN